MASYNFQPALEGRLLFEWGFAAYTCQYAAFWIMDIVMFRKAFRLGAPRGPTFRHFNHNLRNRVWTCMLSRTCIF